MFARMAKKRTSTPASPATPARPASAPPASAASPTSDSAVEQKVVQFAEQLGRIIGTVQAKTDGWLDRKTLTAQISSIRDSAADLLEHVAGMSEGSSTGASSQASSAATRSRGPVDAPGKKHRKPAPSVRGAKHSDERIAKLRLAEANRHRRSGGGRGGSRGGGR